MRTLTDHIVENDSANHQIELHVMDEPGAKRADVLFTEFRSLQLNKKPRKVSK